jgi:hypothetical protein
MQRISLVNIAHDLIREVLHPGDYAIDATVGNGHDTVFLIEQISPSGKVFGFDIQQSAIDSTKIKVGSYQFDESEDSKAPVQPECLTLLHANHAYMGEKIPPHYHGKINAIMFNLGYLPGGDKRIITCTDSTITALNNACRLLSSTGIITVLAYPGHQGGDLETEHVENWCKQLDENQFKISMVYSSAYNKSAPRLFVIRKMPTIPNLKPC